MLTLYGIPNCDTVRKARKWLTARGVDYRFHDFRKDGLDSAVLRRWAAAVGWESLLNRRGQTWRKLDAGVRERESMDEAAALEWMAREPTLIKRPVVEWPDGSVTVGFDAADWEARLA